MTITITDEQFNGTITNEVNVDFSSNTVTVAEIIAERVKAEVNAYNNKQPEYYKGLVDPTDAEKTLNGIKLKTRRMIDAEEQVYIALGAFKKNAFFLLINNLQVEDLQQSIDLNERSRISFVKLTPLVGG